MVDAQELVEYGRREAAELIASGADERTMGVGLDVIRPVNASLAVHTFRASLMDELHTRALADNESRCLSAESSRDGA